MVAFGKRNIGGKVRRCFSARREAAVVDDVPQGERTACRRVKNVRVEESEQGQPVIEHLCGNQAEQDRKQPSAVG